jgi:sugar-specific transcriptional regulator TrmB
MIQLLTKAGLTKYESLAYKALINAGSGSAYKLSRGSGVPLSKIYEILELLVEKGLVSVSMTKPKIYSITNPKNALNNLFIEKERVIEENKKEVIEFFEEFNPIKINDSVKVYKTVDRLGIFEQNLRKAKEYHYSIFSNLPPIGYGFRRLIKKKLSEGVDVKGIVMLNKDNEKHIKEWTSFLPGVYKVIKKPQTTKIALSDDHLTHISLSPSNTVINIDDPDFCRFVKKSFLSTWAESKES